ncbi:ABC transporter permease [Rhodanobacter sp. 7MK24]|uniref:ADOP family duplicated permease n=1 Tax=Rhodanobacter sp. 7MK24 TaxID=2775922 RepID=UPI001785EDF0|nr:ADOP family duplicated permease [Rhodanobacter sp. 7MK24]MBD8881505.1 ABC transporter permease [Rhodanobacter sp. 7MK24]
MNIWLTEIWRAWRAMLRRPGYLTLAVGVLALGIGASVAVFALVNAMLLQPLAYPRASELVQVGQEKYGVAYWISPSEYQHLPPLQGVRSLGLIEADALSVNIAGDGTPELVPAIHADHGYLPTLEIKPLLGRNFTEDEDRPNGPKAVMLSHGFWLRRYGGNAGVIGRVLSIEGVAHAIVGVLPEGVDLKQGDLVLPVAFPLESTDDNSNNYRAIARLAPGATAASVGAEVDTRLHAVFAAKHDAGSEYMRGLRFRADDLKTAMRVNARPVLTMFLASASLVLLIAWVNLANLMLLRTLSHGHDAAVRGALGASWGRQVSPMLSEGVLIGLGGTLTGIALGWLGLNLLSGLIPPEWFAGSRLHFSISTVAVAFCLGMAAALLAAALGLWRGLSAISMEDLRAGGRGSAGHRDGPLGRVLVMAQVALAATLLCAAGLFLHALHDAAHVPLGFSSKGVFTFELAPVKADYSDAASLQQLTRRLLDRLRAQPGVERAAVGTGLPMGDKTQNFYMGYVHAPGAEDLLANSPQVRGVDPDYFPTFGITPREGRGFQDTDVRGGEPVAIVNQTLAQRLYGGHALGHAIDIGTAENSVGVRPFSARIVGVVDDISPFGPLGDRDGILYLSMQQVPDDLAGLMRNYLPLRFALRVHGDPESYRAAVAAAVAEVAPDQPIAHMRSMQSIVSGTTDAARMDLLLIGIFAVLALALAAAGIYAVVSVAVTLREREFGVRLALGASPSRLVRSVLRGALLQIVVGLGMGLGIAFVLAGVLRAVLVQMQRSVFDPAVLLVVCLLLMAVGLLACLWPALRASRVPPMRALRGE